MYRNCPKTVFFSFILSIFVIGTAVVVPGQGPLKAQEVSELDGQPVLLKHLPDLDKVGPTAKFTSDKAELNIAAGNRPVLGVLEFPSGTEAVTAVYPEGRLVIVEYTNPQASVETDSKIQHFLVTNPQTGLVYRRIGNYNAFVFDAADPVAATSLL